MRLKGEQCSVCLGLDSDAPAGSTTTTASGSNRGGLGAAARTALQLLRPPYGAGAGQGGPGRGLGGARLQQQPDTPGQLWSRAMVSCGVGLRRAGAARWWALECGALLPGGSADDPGDDDDPGDGGDYDDGANTDAEGGGSGGGIITGGTQGRWRLAAAAAAPCGGAGPSLQGPLAIAVLEPVQAGLLGTTLSHFGITGLYLTFVLALGRFLRLRCGPEGWTGCRCRSTAPTSSLRRRASTPRRIKTTPPCPPPHAHAQRTQVHMLTHSPHLPCPTCLHPPP